MADKIEHGNNVTGILLYQHQGLPSLFGDTLLSSQAPLDSQFKVPSAGFLDLEPEKYKPCGLCQKIVIIGTNSAYLWAGILSEVVEFDKRIRPLAKRLEVGLDDEIALSLNELLGTISLDTSVILIVRMNQVIHQISFRNCEILDIKGFDHVLYAGYGGGIMATELMTLRDRIPDSMFIEGADRGDSDTFLPTTILESIFQSKFLFQEYAHLSTGAIVEMATFYPNQIRKNGSTLFLCWDENLRFPFSVFPFMAIKRFYIEDVMHVSLHNYLGKRRQVFSIGHPGNLNPCPPTDVREFEPLYGDIENIHTIRYRTSGIVSHRGESANIIRDHFSYCPMMGCIIYSDWFHKDYIETRKQTDLIEYPY